MQKIAASLFFLGLVGACHWWTNRSDTVVLQSEFISVQMPDGAPNDAVLVLAPLNCPSTEAERAESLIRQLSAEGIPVVRGASISFSISNPSASQRLGVDRAIAVFKSGAPAVFVGGMGMSNPSMEQVLNEYNRLVK